MTKTVKLQKELKRMSDQLEDLCFDMGIEPPSEAAKLELAGNLSEIINSALNLAGKYGLSALAGIGLYSAVVSDGQLTVNELIRQLLNSSRNVGVFADDLRRLADEVERTAKKSPDGESDGAI